MTASAVSPMTRPEGAFDAPQAPMTASAVSPMTAHAVSPLTASVREPPDAPQALLTKQSCAPCLNFPSLLRDTVLLPTIP